MQRRIITIVMLIMCLLLASYIQCHAGDWEFNIMGINPADFKGRDWKVMVVGAVVSLAVHELGHIAIADINGEASFSDMTVRWHGYHNHSHSTQQLFHRAGFLSQLLVGGVLTAIPVTRHSDFALGFNGFTAGNTAIYTIGGGRNPDVSDIRQLDHGVLEGTVYSLGAAALTYINLNKE